MLNKGVTVKGHHNTNFVVRLDDSFAELLGAAPGDFAKLRVPLDSPVVVVRTWSSEAELLGRLQDRLTGIPYCLKAWGNHSVHTYAQGRTLSQIPAEEEPLSERRLKALAQVLADTAAVRRHELPELPEGWPEDGETNEFLRFLAERTDAQVHQAHRQKYGSLFDDLNVPVDAMRRFLEGARRLDSRPFGLLHTDLHRDNVVVRRGGGPLFVLDWELATYGDPLHDLATHIVRMAYTPAQRERMERLWAEAVSEKKELVGATAGMETDLDVYIGFEYAQSVYPDLIRAASLRSDRPGHSVSPEAVALARRALLRAEEPLRLGHVPDEDAVHEALRKWHEDQHGGRRRIWSRTRPVPGPEAELEAEPKPEPDLATTGAGAAVAGGAASLSIAE
jgi:aminoglycoside phosphotransferase (APT) family kinase protein